MKLTRMLPRGPVMTPWERTRAFPGPTPSGARYQARVGELAAPVLPVMPFGLAYDLDLVVVTRHPTWNMHELARVLTPQGPLWLCKDAREGSLEQTIVADLPDIDQWCPEVPVQRRRHPVALDDRSTDRLVDLSIAYENFDGERVEIDLRGKPPRGAERLRNGSTMGHSRHHLLAALDLSHKRFASAQVRYDGKPTPVTRLLGLVPFALTMHQTQGGLVTGHFRQQDAEGGFTLTHLRQPPTPARRWHLTREPWGAACQERDALRAITHRFLTPDEHRLELVGVEVSQWDRPAPPTHMALHPALPDLRWRFEGRHTSRFVLDINGQPSHAIGALHAWWEDDGPRVALAPEAPWWTTDRPMLTSVSFAGDQATVTIARTPAPEL